MNLLGNDTTPTKWIMRLAAVLLGFLLLSLNSKLEALQNEHAQLLTIAQVQCYNHAENVPNMLLRATQQRRCLEKRITLDE
jgi:hypothetical protein